MAAPAYREEASWNPLSARSTPPMASWRECTASPKYVSSRPSPKAGGGGPGSGGGGGAGQPAALGSARRAAAARVNAAGGGAAYVSPQAQYVSTRPSWQAFAYPAGKENGWP
jgi:hypothetical protein